MRTLKNTNHPNPYMEVQAHDDPGIQEYSIVGLHEAHGANYAEICIQTGDIPEKGVNGCSPQDVILVLMDHLQQEQETPEECVENEIALHNLQQAQLWLDFKQRKKQKDGKQDA